MIERILLQLLLQLGSFLLTKAFEKSNKPDSPIKSDIEIDQNLKSFKIALKEAINGQPVTPDQRKKLNEAIKNFIKSDSSGL